MKTAGFLTVFVCANLKESIFKHRHCRHFLVKMIKFVLLLLLPTIILSRECIFHTDTVHTVNPPRFQGESGTGTKQYECLEGDNYCVYFEGIFETTGRNQTFDVRSCESDLMYYIGPIGETIGHELEVRCQVNAYQ